MTTSAVVTAAHVSSALVYPSRNSCPVYPCLRSVRTVVKCGHTTVSRRLVSTSLIFIQFFAVSKGALAEGGMDKYMKKKKLDPLEAYIPAVILTELQIRELGQYLDVDQPKFADCRSLLRSGPASSLRVNIRAVAQYASDAGNGKAAFTEVDQCLRALEELDSRLLRASRKDSGASIESMKLNVDTALNALNSLLKTVPSDVLDKGKAMAEAYLTPSEDLTPDTTVDPQLKELESILL